MKCSCCGPGMYLEACVSVHVKKNFFYDFHNLEKNTLFTADPKPNIKVNVIFCNFDLLFKNDCFNSFTSHPLKQYIFDGNSLTLFLKEYNCELYY